jgi:large subunit ribosomal protein L4
MRSALSAHALRGSLGVLDPGGFDSPSTKDAAELLGAWGQEAPLLLVAQPEEEALIKSFRNLARVEITVPSDLEVNQLIRAQSLLITEPALEQVQGKAS